jgi:integrase
MLRNYLKAAEIGRASIHTLRHTFGARYMAKRTSQKTIQEVMGLKDARSSSVYFAMTKKAYTNSNRKTYCKKLMFPLE